VAQLRTNRLDFRDDLVQDPDAGFLNPYSDPNSGTFYDRPILGRGRGTNNDYYILGRCRSAYGFRAPKCKPRRIFREIFGGWGVNCNIKHFSLRAHFKSRPICTEITGIRPRQPAHKTFSSKRRF